MKICHVCKKEISSEQWIGRQSQCLFCGADLRCCRNCRFYDSRAYNDCRENQAERVLDKTRANFCDFFSYGDFDGRADMPTVQARDKLEDLFKK